jgi:dGTPase
VKKEKNKRGAPSPTNSLYPSSHSQRIVPIQSDSDQLEPYRTPWRRDYARLIHSAAFRRLQGKTQLFPGRESDFFRNRLTHSLEVAQIAKSIALKVNYENKYFTKNPINADLVETAALAHDLGHPPFGHNGEHALDDCMKTDGGFEGNAQTLRILAKLEKRQTKGDDLDLEVPILNGDDNRAGLNLTFRTLAAVLKYDNEIPAHRKKSQSVVKGYYYTEKDVVAQIKKHLGVSEHTPLKTIECSIMDLADDIAYSTYDIEDAFKANFLSPVSMMAVEYSRAERIASEVKKRLKKAYPDKTGPEVDFSIDDVFLTIMECFKDIWGFGTSTLEEFKRGDWSPEIATSSIASTSTLASNKMASNGYYRSRITSEFVGQYIRSVNIEFNKESPLLSKVVVDVKTFKRIELLKIFAFNALIMSPMLKVSEYRGKDIVKQIFRALTDDDGYLLMPSDFQELYLELNHPAQKKRVICDFIAGMTDRYAVQFYGRLFGTNPETIFSPI